MNIKNKKLNGVIIALIFVAILVATGPLNKVMKRVLNDISEVTGSHTYLTASFEYLDNEGNEVDDVDDEILVFLSKEDNGEKNVVSLKLKANDVEQKISEIYDQNGQKINDSNNHKINGKYSVVVAVPKSEYNNDEFKPNKQLDDNNYNKYKNGESYNGSFVITYDETIEISSNETSKLKIVVKERDGKRISASDMIKPLNLATSFGVFALKFSQSTDIEATVGVQTFEKNGHQTYGLSDRNFEPFKKYDTNGTIVVDKKYVKDNNVPIEDKEITINLKSSTNFVKTQKCTTNSDGICSVTFDNLSVGIYNVSETIDEQIIENNQTIVTKDGNSITVEFSNNSIKILGYDELQDISYNYNYIEKIGSNKEEVHLEKIRKPGTLVLGSQKLVDEYKKNNELQSTDDKQKVIVALAGKDGYNQINFDEEFDKLKKLSVEFATAIDSKDVKVYYKNVDEIKNKDIDFKSEKKKYILVNIDCGNSSEVIIGGRNKIDGKDLNNTSFEYDEGSKIIYNFYTKNGNEINTYNHNIKTDDSTSGIILAPDADVEGAKGNHSGTIIAKFYNHKDGEVHQKVKPKWIDTDTPAATITNKLIEKEEEKKEQDVSIGKVDANNKPIAGAELQLLDKDNKVIESWTSTTELHKVEIELEKGESYTVHELTAPEGYQLAQDYEFTYNDETITYSMIDTKVIVNKTDEETKLLPGATLQILDSEGSIVEQWVSDGKEHYVNNQLKSGETYILHEEKAPEGYKKAEDVKFVYESNDKDQTVEMKDQKIVIGVFVEKKNMNDELLSGAHLQVLDSNGTILDDWISDGTVHRVNRNLNIGEIYTLHEEEAPEGYEVSPDVSFEVKNTEDNQIVTMVDNKIIIPGEPYVKIRKEDKDGKLLEGAELQLLDSEGNVIEEWTSNDKEHIVDIKLEVGKQYTLHEKNAPKGYEKAEDITFVAQENEQEIKMIDKRIKKVAGVVETLDKITKYVTIFAITLSLLLLGLYTYRKLNKRYTE